MSAYPPSIAGEVLEFILAGNQRFQTGKFENPASNVERRKETVEAQHPFAAVLCCSDSRVPPELVFDKRLGDLFVVRNAGNVLDDVAIGSLEYAVDHLGVPLIVVLGHEKCGAVTAAVQGGHAPGHIGSIIHRLQPAVAATRGQPGDAVLNAALANVRAGVAAIQAAEPILAGAVKSGQVRVVGGLYHLDTGGFELI